MDDDSHDSPALEIEITPEMIDEDDDAEMWVIPMAGGLEAVFAASSPLGREALKGDDRLQALARLFLYEKRAFSFF